MTAPAWLTTEQRAGYDRGAERATTDCANLHAPTVTDVTLDRGGPDGRIHIGWCLLCEAPTTRCSCDNADAAEALIEDPDDVETDVTALLSWTREQLQLHADAATAMVDVEVAGERL